MRCPGKELDTFGKRSAGAGPQPVASPDKKTVGCNITCRDEVKNHKFSIEPGASYKFSINQCESHVKSGLDTICLSIDSRDTRKLKFLIDTGAEISIIRSSSLTRGVEYQLYEGVDIKGISSTVMKTEGTIDLKLFAHTHETTLTFHVLGGNSELPYDAILGKDFFKRGKA
jgi:hypothetical protein